MFSGYIALLKQFGTGSIFYDTSFGYNYSFLIITKLVAIEMHSQTSIGLMLKRPMNEENKVVEYSTA